MAKILTITDKTTGNTYQLEYTRATVAQMEKRGFIADDVSKKPASMLPELFAGAFLAHHKFLKQDVIENIFNQIAERDKLIQKLVEMYNDPIMTLLAEPDLGEAEGNLTWTTEW